MRKPILYDYFCGAGGMTEGFQRAGFCVVGIDKHPQPNYCGSVFVQDDAMLHLAEIARGGPPFPFAAAHASPPCPLYSLTGQATQAAEDHPDLVGGVRYLLDLIGLPYVIENVKGAPLRNPQVLEGQMFGLNTHRPRLFETNWGYEAPFLRPPPPRQAKMGRRPKEGEAIQVVGHFADKPAAEDAMGIDWMTGRELAQAIPPAYAEHIGLQLMCHIEASSTEAHAA